MNPKPEISVSWVRLDLPGAETASLARLADGWRLVGTVVVTENDTPAEFRYKIVCTVAWKTVSAAVRGHVGLRPIDVVIEHGTSGWFLNRSLVPSVESAIDVDLSFSPSTNLLPLWRLGLRLGVREAVKSAWLRYPELDLVPLEQFYTRTSESEIFYESPSVTGTIVLHPSGFVREYPGLWRLVATAA